MTIDSPELVDTTYAAAYFKKSKRTIEQWLRKGEIPGVKVGRTWYIEREALNQRVRAS